MVKVSRCIHVDDLSWQIFTEMYPRQASAMIQDFIDKCIQLDDEESELLKKLAELQSNVDAIETKLCKIRQDKQSEEKAHEIAIETGEVYEELLQDVERRYLHDHIIGRNFLKRIAKAKEVDANVLERMVKDEGIEVSEYEMGLKESNIKTPLH